MVFEDVFMDAKVLEADCVVGLDTIWRVAGNSGSS